MCEHDRGTLAPRRKGRGGREQDTGEGYILAGEFDCLLTEVVVR